MLNFSMRKKKTPTDFHAIWGIPKVGDYSANIWLSCFVAAENCFRLWLGGETLDVFFVFVFVLQMVFVRKRTRSFLNGLGCFYKYFGIVLQDTETGSKPGIGQKLAAFAETPTWG